MLPFSGGHGAGAIPVPIPNTEVKTRRGDGTASLGGGRVARRQIFFLGSFPGGHSPHPPPREAPFFVPRRHRRNTDAETEGRGGRGEVNLEICGNFQDSRAVSKNDAAIYGRGRPPGGPFREMGLPAALSDLNLWRDRMSPLPINGTFPLPEVRHPVAPNFIARLEAAPPEAARQMATVI